MFDCVFVLFRSAFDTYVEDDVIAHAVRCGDGAAYFDIPAVVDVIRPFYPRKILN